MAAAKGLRSTPWMPCSARSARARSPSCGARRRQRSSRAVERAEQEVAGAAGGIDHADAVEAELVDGRLERAVEDEGFNEVGGLEQGVLLAGRCRQVLVEVAEEAGGATGVREVPAQRAGLRHHLPPIGEEGPHTVVGRAEHPYRVVGLEHVGQSGSAAAARNTLET
jgi:hypothetical protein